MVSNRLLILAPRIEGDVHVQRTWLRDGVSLHFWAKRCWTTTSWNIRLQQVPRLFMALSKVLSDAWFKSLVRTR